MSLRLTLINENKERVGGHPHAQRAPARQGDRAPQTPIFMVDPSTEGVICDNSDAHTLLAGYNPKYSCLSIVAYSPFPHFHLPCYALPCYEGALRPSQERSSAHVQIVVLESLGRGGPSSARHQPQAVQ